MSYEPTNWQTGDIVTAEKLNKIETGIVNASSGITNKFVLLPYKYSGNSGGFIKSSSGNVDTFYTYDEVLQMYNDSDGCLCAVDIGGSGISVDTVSKVYFDGSTEVFTFSIISFYVPEFNEGQTTSNMPIYAGTVTLSKTDGYSFVYHSWVFDVTNDD